LWPEAVADAVDTFLNRAAPDQALAVTPVNPGDLAANTADYDVPMKAAARAPNQAGAWGEKAKAGPAVEVNAVMAVEVVNQAI
jgi:hypothetical protein